MSLLWLSLFGVMGVQTTVGAQSPEITSLQPISRKAENEAAVDVQVHGETDGEAGFEVTGVRFSGNSAFSDETLYAVVSDFLYRHLVFEDLEEMARKVTRYYREAGFVGSQAYLPPQQIEGGVVEIAVVEGRYGAIDIRNDSRLLDSKAWPYVAAFTPGVLIEGDKLEARMASLSSLAGVRAHSTLVPGKEPGTADLIINLSDGPRFSGTIELDNTGNRYAGQPRAGVTLIANNFAGYGGRVVLRATSSGGPEFFHHHIAYEEPLPLGSPGQVWPSELSIVYNKVRYELGDAFSVLDAAGWASTFSTSLKIPLSVHIDSSGHSRLSTHLDYTLKQFGDFQGSSSGAVREIRQLDAGINHTRQGVSQRPTFVDRWLSMGSVQSQFQAMVTAGTLRFNSPTAHLLDQLTAKTNGRFYKVNARYSASWMYKSSEIYGSVRAQWGSKNLDTSEKMSLGGFGGVRAYPAGDSSGDDAVVASLELRKGLFSGKPNTTWANARLQGIFFVDAGVARLYKNPWGTGVGAANERRLAGVGVGIHWTQGAFALSLQHGWRLGSAKATADIDTGGRLWINASYRY